MQNLPTAAANPSRSVTLATTAQLSFLLDLQKKFSNQLGFLPRQAIQEYVDTRRVLIARENGEPAGYLLAPRRLASLPHVVPLVQTAIAFDAQRRGLGLLLVDVVTAWAISDGRSMLQAWCRADLTANDFWRSAGFFPVAQRRTPNARRQPLILWRRPLTAILPTAMLALPTRAGHAGRSVTDARHLTESQLTAILHPNGDVAHSSPGQSRRRVA
jgi:GNAT superfamily N-acetyltransferase